jgi:type IV secretion system protein VirB10
MTDDPNQADVSERLARLEAGNGGGPVTATRRSPLMALLVVALIGLAGAIFYLLNQPEEEVVLPTATPDEFQPEGDGFGTIEPFVPPEPETRIVEAEPAPVEPNAELLAQIAALQAQIEAIQNAPEPVVEEDTAAA